MKARSEIKKEAAADAARVLGVQVLEGELDRDRLGGLVMVPGEEPKIYMNQLDLLVRRRLTCAVELGHYVRRSATAAEYGRSDRQSDHSETRQDPESTYAEEFAACLLLPDLDVRVMIELGVDDLEMALRFQVPRRVVQLRLNDLGVRTVEPLEA